MNRLRVFLCVFGGIAAVIFLAVALLGALAAEPRTALTFLAMSALCAVLAWRLR